MKVRTLPFMLEPLRFFVGICSIMLGLGFIRYFDRFVYFPWFPNILDSGFMVFAGGLLLYEVVMNKRTRN